MNHPLGGPHLKTLPSQEDALRQRAAEREISSLYTPEFKAHPQPDTDLDSIRNAILDLHQEIRDHFGVALQKGIEIGGKLNEVQAALKQTRGYEDWIRANLPFSVRSARDYVLLFLNQRELIENKASRDQLSVRGALKLIRDSAKQAEPCTPEAPPPKVEAPAEGKLSKHARVIVIIEAESTLVAQILSSLQTAKRTSKDVRYLQFRISAPGPARWIARSKLFLVARWKKLAQLKKFFEETPNRSLTTEHLSGRGHTDDAHPPASNNEKHKNQN